MHAACCRGRLLALKIAAHEDIAHALASGAAGKGTIDQLLNRFTAGSRFQGFPKAQRKRVPGEQMRPTQLPQQFANGVDRPV